MSTIEYILHKKIEELVFEVLQTDFFIKLTLTFDLNIIFAIIVIIGSSSSKNTRGICVASHKKSEYI